MRSKLHLLKHVWYITGVCFLSGCCRLSDTIAPHINYQPEAAHFSHLKSAFPSLDLQERDTDWGKEMVIAQGFAKEFDLYRAVSTYKRAEFLIPVDSQRLAEIHYDILLCYYLGQRYQEAIESFERSDLSRVDPSFPAYRDLLVILHDCFSKVSLSDKDETIYELIERDFPQTAKQVCLSQALREGNIKEIQQISSEVPDYAHLSKTLDDYHVQRKSVKKAQLLNAFIPGAGYFYIGQKKSAFTAFTLNALFIAAAYEFFHRGYIAGGAITLCFEAGWYFGGIYGAGEEAKFYNESIYERNVSHILTAQSLFPGLMLRHAF